MSCRTTSGNRRYSRTSTVPATAADTILLSSRYGICQPKPPTPSMNSLRQSVCRMVFKLSKAKAARNTGSTTQQADRNTKSLSAGRIRLPRYRKSFISLTLSSPAGCPCAAGRAAAVRRRSRFGLDQYDILRLDIPVYICVVAERRVRHSAEFRATRSTTALYG